MLSFYTGQQILDETQKWLSLAPFSHTPCHKWAFGTKVLCCFSLCSFIPEGRRLIWVAKRINTDSWTSLRNYAGFGNTLAAARTVSCHSFHCVPSLQSTKFSMKNCYCSVERIFLEQTGSWAPTTLVTHSISPHLKWLICHVLVLGCGTKWLKGCHREEIKSLQRCGEEHRDSEN